MKIVLLDAAAQAHSAELAQLTNIECLALPAENLNADLLFVVGDFDQVETQQAVKNLPKSANSFQMAIQLGKENGLWADSTVLLREGQTVFDFVTAMTQFVGQSDEDTAITVDWLDIQQVCQGLRCQFISTNLFDGENRMENASQQIISKLPENIVGIACLIRTDKSFELEAFMSLQDNLCSAINEDTMMAVGSHLDHAMNGKISLVALVSCA